MKKTLLMVVGLMGLIVLLNGCVETPTGVECKTDCTIAVPEPCTGKGICKTCPAGQDCSWVSTNCCPENAGAHWECINKTESKLDCPANPVCLQVISPKPEESCNCVKGYCFTIKQSPITIKTDKTEYEQGETVKVTSEITGTLYNWHTIPWIEKKVGGKWVSAEGGSGFDCFSKMSCEEFLRLPQPVRPLCKKLKSGLWRQWTQTASIYGTPACEWEGKPERSPYCRISHKAEAGTYRFGFRYWLDENCAMEEFPVKSNEFTIKAPKEIVELCAKEGKIIEARKNDLLCEDGFRCVDGWSDTYYYDGRLTKERPVSPIDTPEKLPTALENAVIAKYFRSNCSCVKPIVYTMATSSGLKETECEAYYSFLKDYNSACNGCILEWETGCC